jgi:hypothetical protein
VRVDYLHLTPETAPPPRPPEPLCVVLISEARAKDIWRGQVLEWAQRAGCVYFIAWGENCERWHDDMDDVHLETYAYKPPDDKFMMTTWHANETLEEALWFAKFNVEHPAVRIKRTLLLHIAEKPDEARLRRAWGSLLE